MSVLARSETGTCHAEQVRFAPLTPWRFDACRCRCRRQPGVEDLALRAEELGLHSFWVNDTPMVHGDPFVALSLCAKATSRIRLGIGVTSPALLSAPAAASGLASLNALAPGRIICGVGTGNTARRTLGMRPATAARLENFTAALQDCAPAAAARASSPSACWTPPHGTRCTTPAATPPRAHPKAPTPTRAPTWSPRSTCSTRTRTPTATRPGTRRATSSCRCWPSPPTQPPTHPPPPGNSARRNARRCGGSSTGAAPPPPRRTGTPSSTPTTSDASHRRTATWFCPR
ncbi:LLM class flavin-dependent oxidoreductase [Streptomyces syringium]|uniref:LLM class flavin-dependent oxidoreductase n=1 Tax=Streptomyces syringium TaxID=76729 RepID=UPI003AAE3166